jgi:hypothetical protein
MAFAFEKLIVYQKAIDFTDAICQSTEHFPRGYGYLAEGNGRFTKPDRKNFLELHAALHRNAYHCWNWHAALPYHRSAASGIQGATGRNLANAIGLD